MYQRSILRGKQCTKEAMLRIKQNSKEAFCEESSVSNGASKAVFGGSNLKVKQCSKGVFSECTGAAGSNRTTVDQALLQLKRRPNVEGRVPEEAVSHSLGRQGRQGIRAVRRDTRMQVALDIATRVCLGCTGRMAVRDSRPLARDGPGCGEGAGAG